MWKNSEKWPVKPESYDDLSNDVEIRRETNLYVALITANDVHENPTDELLQRYSSWYKLKKGVAWVLKIKNYLLDKVKGKEPMGSQKMGLSVETLKEAERAAIKYVQERIYPEETKIIRKDGDGLKKSSPLFLLEPVCGQEGILCVGSRLTYATITEDGKRQILVQKSHHIAELIAQHDHQLSGHCGREHVLSLIRERYWIIGARTVINRVIRHCFSCKRCCAPLGTQRMAPLPAERVTPNKPPFTFVGVDCFGPFFM